MVRSQADFLCQWSNIIHCHTTDIDYTGGSTAKGVNTDSTPPGNTWSEVIKGIRLLFGNKILRFSLSIEFISAIAGAMVLVNTVGLVKHL